MILDVGPKSPSNQDQCLDRPRPTTLVWNGPLGAFEIAPFDTATVSAAPNMPPRRTR
jgi:phosphoglycerate kinase